MSKAIAALERQRQETTEARVECQRLQDALLVAQVPRFKQKFCLRSRTPIMAFLMKLQSSMNRITVNVAVQIPHRELLIVF
jgi:hypothetical protein